MFSADPWVWILAAVMILTIPLNWLCAALAAAAFHECCHIWMIRICGGRIYQIRIGLDGTVIETDGLSYGQELLCALAGPVGSLSLLLLCRHMPRLALAGGIQGLYNLLPIYPLDGGRALRCILCLRLPRLASKLQNWIEGIFLIFLTVMCIWAAIRLSLGIFPVVLALICAAKAILRKKPCKPDRIRVQ